MVALGIALCAPSWAQNVNSRLTGMAKDAQGGVLPGVTVTATSPALIGSQTAITATNGSFLFPSLPSGTYSLKFELQGFQTFTRSGIVLRLGNTLTVNAVMQVASLKENVTVTAESPVVDTQSTAVGNTLDTAKLIGVPASSDLWGVLAQAPGVRMQGFDVGGSHKMQATEYNAFGVFGQNRFIVEGVDVTEVGRAAGGYWDYYSQNEVSVSAAGQDVELNVPGAAVIATIKSGGNQFKSLFNETYEPGGFVGDNIDSAITARGGSAAKNQLYWETHADLGGPIERDKIWFFAAYNHFHIDKAISGVPISVATNLMIDDGFVTKETWKASHRDTVTGYFQWFKKLEPERGLSNTIPLASTLAERNPGWQSSVKWQRVWSDRLFTEINGGMWYQDFPEKPALDYRTDPPRVDVLTDARSGAGWTDGNWQGSTGPGETQRDRPQVFVKSTYFLPTENAGTHDLKFGFDWMDIIANHSSDGASGPILYLDEGEQANEILLTDVGDPSKLGDTWTLPSDNTKHLALYAQDGWRANSHITFTAGVRYDREQPYYREGKRDPVLTEVFLKRTVPGRNLFVSNSVTPRLGLSFDPAGDGKAAIKTFYGRYYYNFSSDFANINPTGPSSKTFQFLDQNGNKLYDGPHELGTLLSATGGVSTTLDPSLKTPHTDEFDLSYQRQFWGESSIRLAYVRKMVRDEFDTFNAAREGEFTVPLTETVTLENTEGVTGAQTFTVYDVPDSLRGVVRNVIATMPATVDRGAYNYDTFELAFNKRFSQGLFLNSSFDWTHSDDLRDNVARNDPLTQADPIRNGYYQNVYPSVGNRQTTTSWDFQMSSRYELPHEVGIGANLRVQGGWEYARQITVRLPNSGTQRFWATNLGDGGQRSQTVPLLNLRFDKAFEFGGHRLTGMVDLFNVINSNAIVNFNLSNGSRFQQINSLLDPRTLELSVRFEF